MAPSKDQLLSVLKAAGHQPRVVASEDGAALAVLPHGGRILGLFSDESDTNFLWTIRRWHAPRLPRNISPLRTGTTVAAIALGSLRRSISFFQIFPT